MNEKTAKLLRKIAPRMGVSYESAKQAFEKLDPIQQLAFVQKAKDRLEYYGKSSQHQTAQ